MSIQPIIARRLQIAGQEVFDDSIARTDLGWKHEYDLQKNNERYAGKPEGFH